MGQWPGPTINLKACETLLESAHASLESAQWVDMPLSQGTLPFSGLSSACIKWLDHEMSWKFSDCGRHKEGWSLSKAQGGVVSLKGTRRGGLSWLGRGLVASPKKIFKFKMSVEAILMNFEAIFFVENKLILQACHFFLWKQAYFTSISCISNSYHIFFVPLPSVLLTNILTPQ